MTKGHIRRKGLGRHITAVGSIGMTVWPGYELYIRMDDIRIALEADCNYCKRTGVSFWEMQWIKFETTPSLRIQAAVVLFLMFCVVYGICALCLRNRTKAAVALTIGGIVLGVIGLQLGVYGSSMTQIVQLLKIIPLMMVMIGNIITAIAGIVRAKSERQRAEADHGHND